jgi:hypothetical protein
LAGVGSVRSKMRRSYPRALAAVCVLAAALFMTACGSSASSSSDGAALLNERCTKCHAVDRVTSLKKDQAGWQATVDRMRSHGANLTDTEATALVAYLAKQYGTQ